MNRTTHGIHWRGRGYRSTKMLTDQSRRKQRTHYLLCCCRQHESKQKAFSYFVVWHIRGSRGDRYLARLLIHLSVLHALLLLSLCCDRHEKLGTIRTSNTIRPSTTNQRPHLCLVLFLSQTCGASHSPSARSIPRTPGVALRWRHGYSRLCCSHVDKRSERTRGRSQLRRGRTGVCFESRVGKL